MINTLKSYIQNRETEKLEDFIFNNPNVLDETDESGASGLLLVVYSGIKTAVDKAIAIKKTFTFHEAIVCGMMETVKDFLKDNQGVVNTYSADGFTPLSLATFFERTEIAKLLFEKGADPTLHATNPSNVNALHSAVARSNYELSKLLVDAGVNVNATQSQNVTPLHSAAHNGNLQLVKLLVEHGAKINLKMDNGMTAIDFAEKDGHAEVKAYLESKVKNSHA